jgi:hypothetical protein
MVVAILLTVAVGCSSEDSGSPSTSATGFPAPEVTAPRTVASRSVLEPDSVAGIPLGATKDQAQAVLGPATTITSEKDSGGRYDTLRWQLSGGRGLSLSFRSGSRFSPGLTDWRADVAGPATAAGVQVGTAAGDVMAAYGALSPFCCRSKVASIERAGGRLVVVVPDGTQRVEFIGRRPDDVDADHRGLTARGGASGPEATTFKPRSTTRRLVLRSVGDLAKRFIV